MIDHNVLKVVSEIKKAGFEDPEDILFYLPLKYHDYTETIPRMRDGLEREDNVFFRARTKSLPDITFPSKTNKVGRVSLKITDGYELGIINAFGNIWEWKDIVAGQDLYVVGKVTEWQGVISIKAPKLIPSTRINSIFSQYKSRSFKVDKDKKDFHSEFFSKSISIAFNDLVNKAVIKITNFVGLPEQHIIEKTNNIFPSLSEFLKAIHFPKSLEQVEHVASMIKKLHGLKILSDASTIKPHYDEDSVITIGSDDVSKLLRDIPFTLSYEQKRAVWQIMQLLSQPIVTQHLLSGDVGCGKTIVYGIIAAAAFLQGKQVCILLPNLPLAAQVASELATTWKHIDVQTIEEGSKYKYNPSNKKIIVGTTAIIGWAKRNKGFKSDIFIVDEQQKVGVNQKTSLIHNHTNVIEATATALPRSVMLSLTGAYTTSKIETPPVKKMIDSKIIYREQRSELFSLVSQAVQREEQVAILYPLKNESSSVVLHVSSFSINKHQIEFMAEYAPKVKKIELHTEDGTTTVTNKRYYAENSKYAIFPIKSIEFERDILNTDIVNLFEINNINVKLEDRITDVTRAQEEWEKHFPNSTVMMHGGLSDEEKLNAVSLAKKNEKKIIIASSMIEIGLTFPNLKICIVVDPQNMGVSTLHQIRGRLARLGGHGLFYMFINKPESEVPDEYTQRLKLLEKFTKGSELAEHDMLIRGFGDLNAMGISQSGLTQSLFLGSKILPEDLLTVV